MEEEKEPEKEVWNAYTTVKGLSISISGLKEGKRYKFRVAAKNIMGMSSFTETRQPTEIKEQMCKLSCQTNKRSISSALNSYRTKVLNAEYFDGASIGDTGSMLYSIIQDYD